MTAWQNLRAEVPFLAGTLLAVRKALSFGVLPRPGGWPQQTTVFVAMVDALAELGLLDSSRSAERGPATILKGVAAMLGGKG